MKHIAIASLFFISFNLYAVDDWPHILGPNFDSKPVQKEFTATAATTKWTANVGIAMSSVVIADGRLVTMGNSGAGPKGVDGIESVICLNANSGERIWQYDYPHPLDPKQYPGGPNATPTIHDGHVYTLSKTGHIHCLDAITGKLKWQASAKALIPSGRWWGFSGSPTVIGEQVIFNVGNRGLALNRLTGAEIWTSPDTVVAYASPMPLPKHLFGRPALALQTNRDLHILDPTTGASLASYDRDWQEKSHCNGVTPYFHEGKLHVVHSAHGLARLSIVDQKVATDWLSAEARYSSEWFSINTQVIHNGVIFHAMRHRSPEKTGLVSLDAATGKRLKFVTEPGFGSLIGIGSAMIMLAENGELRWGKLEKENFKIEHREMILSGTCWILPVLSSNLLYARNAEGTVVCVTFK